MKKICYTLLFLLTAFKSYSQETEKLPKVPWEEIVEINANKRSSMKIWNTDIKVQLQGNYTKKDSLNVAKVLDKLDAITESIKIEFSKNQEPNFKIVFLDTIVPGENDFYSRKVNSSSYSGKGDIIDSKMYIYNFEQSKEEIKNSLESSIVKMIVNGYFEFLPYIKKRNSIFNGYGNPSNSEPLNDGDIAIIREIYKPNFEKNLKIAEEQFKYVLDDIYKEKVKRRDQSIWWVKNPIALLFLPTLILSLFFIFLISKIKKAIDVKIKRDWLKFGVTSIISLFFMGIIIILGVSTYDFLTIPDDYNKVSLIRIDTVMTTLALLYILVFPFLYVFRFIELKIQKISKSIFTKTVLIFLSTGILPFVLMFSMNYLSGNLKFDSDYTRLSKYFLYTMAFASLRALISFFIFKERNLIVENEMKLSNLRELKTKAELTSLQSQINPHFLYNALNSIASLAHTNADKTEKMALSLSDLFKYTINRKGKETSTVNDELEMVRSYLEIEQTRFGDRLEFVINVEDELLQEEIPMFLLQPLVENAVKHGISKIEDKGVIKLNIIKTNKGLEIEVTDNGPDFPEGLVSGHGLQTVYDLLRLSYGDKAALKWQNKPQKSISIFIHKTA